MLPRYIPVLADPSVIVLIIPREWHPLGAVARMGSAPSFLVIALRTANRHLWHRCRGLTIPSDCAKKCQQGQQLKDPSPKKTTLRKLLDSRPTKRDPP